MAVVLGWLQFLSALALLAFTFWLFLDSIRDWAASAKDGLRGTALYKQAAGTLIMANLRLVVGLLLCAVGALIVSTDSGPTNTRVAGRILLLIITWLELAKAIVERLTRISVFASFAAQPEQLIVAKVLEALPDTVIVIDRHGVIKLVNSQCELMFGYPRGELLGRPVEKLLPLDLQAGHVAFRQAFFKEPSVRPMGIGRILRGRHRDGADISLEINISPLMTSQGLYAVAIARRPR